MDTQSTLTKTSQWVENYPTGYISMKDRKISKFKPALSKHASSMKNSKEILKQGDNTKTKELRVSDKEKIMKPTKALTYENFGVYLEDEQFIPVNMSSHMDPIWVIVTFLLAIWIIYFLAK